MVTRFRRVAPLYQPAVWNVHDATLADQERTNNVCEGWNHAFASLIGHAHPSLWVLVESLKMDEAGVAMDLLKVARGEPPAKRVKRSMEQHQRRSALQTGAMTRSHYKRSFVLWDTVFACISETVKTFS